VCLLFLLFVLDQLLLAIGAGVHFCPRVIEAFVAVPVNVQLAIVAVAGLEMDVDMRVVGILMHRGECSGRGEGPLQVVLSEISRLAGRDVLLEGEHQSVVGARLTMAAPPGSSLLVFLLLPAVVGQVVAQFAVVASLAGVLRVVPGEDRLPIALRRRRPRDVAGVRPAAADAPFRKAHEHAAHPRYSQPRERACDAATV